MEIIRYEKELKKLIETSLDLKLESTSTNAGSTDYGMSSITSRIPLENQRLKGTSYYYQTDKIVHFTSMQTLFSIINEGSVRLYNLNNSNDPEEYIHAANLFNDIYRLQNLNEVSINDKIEEIKEYSFILSSTSMEFLGQKKFWEKYADCGKGVALEFEIIDDISNWENFYCSKVHYNEAHKFDLLIKEWNNLQKKAKNILYDINLNQLLSLHKSKDWGWENEVRILAQYPIICGNSPIDEILFNERICWDFRSNKQNKAIRYFKLPLCDKTGSFIEKNLNERNEYFWSKIPKLRISDIHFGPELEIPAFRRFQERLRTYVCEKTNVWLKNLPKDKIRLQD